MTVPTDAEGGSAYFGGCHLACISLSSGILIGCVAAGAAIATIPRYAARSTTAVALRLVVAAASLSGAGIAPEWRSQQAGSRRRASST